VGSEYQEITAKAFLTESYRNGITRKYAAWRMVYVQALAKTAKIIAHQSVSLGKGYFFYLLIFLTFITARTGIFFRATESYTHHILSLLQKI
jgi:hypothetical protein